jgi:ABC-type transporter Mla subunit MlaD
MEGQRLVMDDAIQRIQQSIDKIDARTEDIAKQLAAVDKTQAVDSERLSNLILRSSGFATDVANLQSRVTELERFQVRVEPVTTKTLPTFQSRLDKIEQEKWKTYYTAVAATVLVVWEVGKFLYPYVKH